MPAGEMIKNKQPQVDKVFLFVLLCFRNVMSSPPLFLIALLSIYVTFNYKGLFVLIAPEAVSNRMAWVLMGFIIQIKQIPMVGWPNTSLNRYTTEKVGRVRKVAVKMCRRSVSMNKGSCL